jgi:hypothetical protein
MYQHKLRHQKVCYAGQLIYTRNVWKPRIPGSLRAGLLRLSGEQVNEALEKML